MKELKKKKKLKGGLRQRWVNEVCPCRSREKWRERRRGGRCGLLKGARKGRIDF